MKTYPIIFLALTAILMTGCMTISTNGSYRLEEGETLRGNLFMTSGETTLEEGSRVTGSVIMTSGTLNVGGSVDGDILYSSAKSINLEPGSYVGGDIKGTSGDVIRAEGAQVEGVISRGQSMTLGTAFFSKAIGILCGIPLIIIGSIVFLITNHRNHAGQAISQPAAPRTADVSGKLKQLKKMHEEGLINGQDYEAKKADLLAKL